GRNSSSAEAFHDAYGRTLRAASASAFPAATRGLPIVFLAGQFAGAEQFSEALLDSGRRESGGGRVAAAPRWQRRRRTGRFRNEKRRSGRGTEVGGRLRQGRSRRGGHPASPGADQLEPQTGGGSSANQLQSPALQDPAVWNRRSQEPPQAFCWRLGPSHQ